MPNTVIALKKSSTPSAVPTGLANGELAINFADGKLFYKNTNGNIVTFSSGTNSFGSINVNGTFVVADSLSDILTLISGTGISISADAINDTITITATGNAVAAFDASNVSNSIAIAAFNKANAALANTTGTFAGTLTATGDLSGQVLISTNATGLEGGEIQLAKPPSGNLSGGLVIDAYADRIRFFESGGTNRGAFLDFRSLAAGVGTNLLASAAGTQGIQGINGVQGIQGFQGLQGTQGIQGSNGFQGLQGLQGPQGIQGANGFQGLQGTQGIQGSNGFQGLQGLQGPQGIQGANGFQGLQGVQGPQGIQGTNGFQGIQGLQGLQGVQGANGFQGIQGLQGPQGIQGSNGFQGIQGTQGIQGLQGSQGTQGFQGLQGPSGPSTIINATNVSVNDTVFPVFVTDAGSNQTAQTSPGLSYNPSSNTLIVDGNVGIGTTTTTSRLHVTSPIFPVARIERTTALTTGSRSSFASVNRTTGDMLDTFGSDISFIIRDNANVDNEIATFGAYREGSDNSGTLIFSTYNSGVFGVKMYILPSGNVGIGIAAPTSNLHVVGTTNITSALTVSSMNVVPTIQAAFDRANSSNSYAESTFVKLISPNQTITGNISITGSLSVAGNTYKVDANTLVIQDPLIYLAGNNYTSDIVDIGFVANYVSANSQNLHTGIFRDATAKEYFVFDSYNQEPNPNHIDTSANGFSLAVLNATIRTSNLILGGANAISWINAAFNKANTVATIQGIQGLQGPQGTQGFQGTQGLQGSNGFQGIQGTQGVQGANGFQGLQGTQGFQGFQGLQGPQGTQGIQGANGFQGLQGTQGIQGANGFQGLQGTQGLQGVQGLQGPQGTQGFQGLQGPTGPSTLINATSVTVNDIVFPVFVTDPGSNQTAQTSPGFTFNPSGNTLNIAGNIVVGGNVIFDTPASTRIWEPAANVLAFFTTQSERMRIDSSGNVAIGVTSTNYRLEVAGSFAAQTKSFVINHPTKDNMKLRYASLEGPENGIYYRGKIEGKSIIELPDYWWNLIDERTISVHLTPFDRSQDIWVQSTSAYYIHLNQPADCFFTVYAERKDVDKLVVEY